MNPFTFVCLKRLNKTKTDLALPKIFSVDLVVHFGFVSFQTVKIALNCQQSNYYYISELVMKIPDESKHFRTCLSSKIQSDIFKCMYLILAVSQVESNLEPYYCEVKVLKICQEWV